MIKLSEEEEQRCRPCDLCLSGDRQYGEHPMNCAKAVDWFARTWFRNGMQTWERDANQVFFIPLEEMKGE